MPWRKNARRALLTIVLVVAPVAASEKLQPHDHVTILTTDGRVFHGVVGSASNETELVVEFQSERLLASTAIPYENIQSILPSAPPIPAVSDPPPALPAALPDQQIAVPTIPLEPDWSQATARPANFDEDSEPDGITSRPLDGLANAAGKQKRLCCCQCWIRSKRHSCLNGDAGR